MSLLLTIIIAAVLPALVLVYFIYRKDKYEPEPKGQLLKAFGFGAISAVASLLISGPLTVIGLAPEEADTIPGHLADAFFGAAIPEELAKFFMLWLFLRRNKYYNEYVDGIVYAACVGMGFAALENIGYLVMNFDEWVSVGVMRALFSVPGHFFFAVSMGYFFSIAWFGDPAKRSRNFFLAVAVPVLLHGVFDFLLMASTSTAGMAATALIQLFLGLYVYMAVMSRGRFIAHMKTDRETRRVEAENREMEEIVARLKDLEVKDVDYLPCEIEDDKQS